MAVKEKILVVDDEPSIRKYLQTLLEVDGFEVETVSSGKDALEKVNKGERPDFIILDVLMPEMNGLETLKELMQVDRSLNVIMLSCSNEVGTVVEVIRIGALDYLTKPFEKTELDAAMLKCRQKKQPHAESLILPVELLFLAAFEHGRVELGLFKWLGEIVERIDAVLLGHENVKNDEVGPVPGADFFNSVLAGRKSLHLEAVHFEEGLQVFADARFVIHDENTFFLRHPCSPFRLRSAQLGSIGIRNLKVLPRCGSLSTQILPRWACTRRLAMARPRPIPDVLGSTRTKSSTIS